MILKSLFLFLAALCFLISPLPASAAEEEALLTDDYIPRELADALPDNVNKDNIGTAGVSEFLTLISDTLSSILKPALQNLAAVLGVVVLSAVFHSLREGFRSDALASALSWLSLVCISLLMYHMLSALWEETKIALQAISALMNAMLPVLTSLYALGGNVSQSALTSSSMMFFFSLIGAFCSSVLYPVFRVCFGVSVISSVSGSFDLSKLSELIRKTVTVILLFLMSLTTTILAYQNAIAASADSAALRTVRFAAGSFIPIVGGAVSEAVRTLSASLSLIKSTVGGLAIVAVVAILLPPFITLFLNKIAISLGGVAADCLGCEREGKFLAECSELLNLAIAMLFSSALIFIIDISLLIKSTAAIA